MTNKNIVLDRQSELHLSCVYKVEFKNGKIYIGQTTNFYRRKIQHRNLRCKDQPLLYNEMLESNGGYEITVVKKCKKEKLDYFEKKYIIKYNSANPINGLNLQHGGIHGLSTEQSKLKRTWSRKPVLQYDINGNFIKEWACISHVCPYVNRKALKTVSTAMKNNKILEGYYWKLKTN